MTEKSKKVVSFRIEDWLAEILKDYMDEKHCNMSVAINNYIGDLLVNLTNAEGEVESLKKDNLSMADELKNFRIEKNLQTYQPPALTVPSEALPRVDPRPEPPQKPTVICPMSNEPAQFVTCVLCARSAYKVFSGCKVRLWNGYP
jgi:hypothetical protein